MKKCNKKGMTLVEVIISMAILGAIAGMFVTIAVAAKNQNKDNYQRQREMYSQAAAAESFDTNVTNYGMDIKVSKLATGGGSDNKVTLSAPFAGYNITTDAYGYLARRQDKDNKDTDYQLRFFRSKNVEVGPNPDEGEYWITVINNSGSDIDFYASTPEADGGQFFDKDLTLYADEPNSMLLDGGKFQFGIIAGTSDPVMGISSNPGMFGGSHSPSAWDKQFSVDEFLDFCDVKDGSATNYITIHLCSDGGIRSQAEYESYVGG